MFSFSSIKKVVSVVPVFLLVASTAFASVSTGGVILLPDGTKACTYPCSAEKNEITMPDGSKVCALHVPQSIDAEVFVIALSDSGKEMVETMRPANAPSGQFSLRANSAMSLEQAKMFGNIVNNSKMVLVRDEKAAVPFGGSFHVTDVVPVSANSKELDYRIGEYTIGQTIKLNVLESLCSSALISADVVISNIEAWTESARIVRPIVSVRTAAQMQNVEFGGGLLIGGLDNIGDVDSSAEYLVFINLQEGEPGKKK